jgi:hypothetical protein
MKGKLLGWILLIGLMLIPFLLCCGVAFADDGSGADNVDVFLIALYAAIGAVAWVLLSLYWDIFKPKLVAIWAVKEDTFRWKLRGTLIAAVVNLWDTLKESYKRGLLDAIISILIKMIKNWFGIPTAYRKASAALNR